MSDCRFGVSPVNHPDPDPDPEDCSECTDPVDIRCPFTLFYIQHKTMSILL